MVVAGGRTSFLHKRDECFQGQFDECNIKLEIVFWEVENGMKKFGNVSNLLNH
jgi:hypothetical protein